MNTQPRSFTKEFKVVAISSNTNSFGLRGVVMVARDGEAWQVGASTINLPRKDAMVTLKFNEDPKGGLQKYPEFPFNCEIPQRKPDPPAELLKEFFRQ